MIPDTCIATLDIRPMPGMSEEDALEPFRQAAGQLWGKGWQDCVDVSGRNFLPPIKCEAGDPVVKLALRCAAALGMTCEVRSFFGACDASFLRINQEMPFFIFGPGIEHQAHKPDEYVQVEDYLAAIEFYKQFAVRHLGG
jgi:succinyl-diaminopimelate desuccinylase